MAEGKRGAIKVLRGIGKGFYYLGKGIWWLGKATGRAIEKENSNYQERQKVEAMHREYYRGIEKEAYIYERGRTGKNRFQGRATRPKGSTKNSLMKCGRCRR
jgi:hypothetical protein